MCFHFLEATGVNREDLAGVHISWAEAAEFLNQLPVWEISVVRDTCYRTFPMDPVHSQTGKSEKFSCFTERGGDWQRVNQR